MPNAMDILGELLQQGLRNPNSSRLESSLGEKGAGAKGGILEEIMKGLAPKESRSAAGASTASAAQATATASQAVDKLKDLASQVLGDPKKAGGLGALVGAIFGGGGKSMRGALSGGALALLGTLALQALRNAQQAQAKPMPDAASQLMAGLRAPETKEEEREVASVAELTLKAMINAAKADGKLDDTEMQRIAGQLKSLPAEDREFLMQELRRPMDTEGLVRAIPNQQVAAQVYAASLLANGGDSPEEKVYLADLAQKLKLDGRVVAYLHQAVGV